MVTARVPAAPKGCGPAGRRLWRSVVDDFELAEHELAILRECARVVDLCADLQARVDIDGVIVDGRAHPLLPELRQQRILVGRLLVSLRVPLGDQESDPAKTGAPRLQRRGTRGVYQPRTLRSAG